MNREQAENILEAYINMECGGGDNKARQSLREVILDAMTEYKVKSNYPSITYPHATWVDTTKTALPTNWDGTPKVTCSGINHAYKQATGVDA